MYFTCPYLRVYEVLSLASTCIEYTKGNQAVLPRRIRHHTVTLPPPGYLPLFFFSPAIFFSPSFITTNLASDKRRTKSMEHTVQVFYKARGKISHFPPVTMISIDNRSIDFLRGKVTISLNMRTFPAKTENVIWNASWVSLTSVYFCHVVTSFTATDWSNCYTAKNNYEGWNFNSGNYLFTTDTK